MIIYRILSAFITIGIIAPIHVLICVLMLIFDIFNSFNYYNFWNTVEVPDKVNELVGHYVWAQVLARILVIFFWSFQRFFEALKMVKTCKF